jgi:hypothetical protein
MDPINEVVLDLDKLMKTTGWNDFIKEVVKATNNATGFSTRQSLSKEVADLTQRKTPLFDMLPREPVINPIHQWDAITAISQTPSFAGAIDSVGNDADPTITRYSENVRYYRVTTTVGQFTQAMSRPELQAQQTVDEKALNAIMYDIEGDLFTGGAGGLNVRGLSNVTASLSPANNNFALNGTLSATTGIDLLTTSIVEGGSIPTHIWFNAADKRSWRNLFLQYVRYNDPAMGRKDKFGYTVMTYLNDFAETDVMWDFFIPAKTGAPAVSTGFVLDISTLALGEPTVNGASGIAFQELAKTGPQTVKLVNYYGLLIYRNVNGLAQLTNIQ